MQPATIEQGNQGMHPHQPQSIPQQEGVVYNLNGKRYVLTGGVVREMHAYRCVASQHLEQDWTKLPGRDGTRPLIKVRAIPQADGTWIPSPTFWSPTDLEMRFNAHGSIKFHRVHDESGLPGVFALPDTAHVWDSDRETLEQFTERMAQLKASQPAPGPHPNATAPAPMNAVVDSVRQGYMDAMQSGGAKLPVDAPQRHPVENQSGASQAVTVPAAPAPAPVTPAASSQKTVITLDQLRKMTDRQLMEYAAEEEIDLQGKTRKDDVIKAIQAAQSK